MLISHRHKFIFTKTKKTAGTSVESLFEPYCMAPGAWRKTHEAPERISEYGVIGYRGNSPGDSLWWNHMSARRIRDQIGIKIWEDYFKFTVIRNPFDKLVSGFCMLEARKADARLGRKIKARVNRCFDRGLAIDRVEGQTEIERFRSWIRLGGDMSDRENYMIDDEICLDYFIRYEDLAGGVEHVMKQLGIDGSASEMARFKGGYRKSKIPLRDYYDAQTEAIVRKSYAFELDYFGYDMPQ